MGGYKIIWDWALINFLAIRVSRLFEVGARERLATYSNKEGSSVISATFFYTSAVAENKFSLFFLQVYDPQM